MTIIVQIIQKTYPPYDYSSLVDLRPYFPIMFDNAEDAKEFLRDKGFTQQKHSELWEKRKDKYGRQNQEAIAWIGMALEEGNMVPMLCDWQEGHAE